MGWCKSSVVLSKWFIPVRSIYFHSLFSLPSSILLKCDTGSHLNLLPVSLTPRWLSCGLDCPAVCVDDPCGKTQAVTLSKGLVSDVGYVPDRRRGWALQGQTAWAWVYFDGLKYAVPIMLGYRRGMSRPFFRPLFTVKTSASGNCSNRLTLS